MRLETPAQVRHSIHWAASDIIYEWYLKRIREAVCQKFRLRTGEQPTTLTEQPERQVKGRAVVMTALRFTSDGELWDVEDE